VYCLERGITLGSVLFGEGITLGSVLFGEGYHIRQYIVWRGVSH